MRSDARGGATPSPAEDFGVYVHVPFCAARCDYCAFATWTDRDHLMGAYVDALHRELASRTRQGELRAATSIFVGGGTPSRLPASELCGVLGAIPTRERAEVTVECNPEDVDVDRLAAYRGAGVTRVSLGVQSTDAGVLRALGRRHGTEEFAHAARAISTVGFTSWNADLIIGTVGESDAALTSTLDDLLGLDSPPPHVSAYALTPEPGTPLGEDLSRHPDDDVVARRYEMVDARLSAAGFRWEEISNWALPGHEARHNQLYWAQGEYVGLGCSAHSHLGGVRSWNVRTPDRYISMVARGDDPTAGHEQLDQPSREFEQLMLSLRTPIGVPVDAFDDLESLDGMIDVRDGRAVLTLRGRLLANQVATRLRTGVTTSDR
jgi:putative oxygen-independent coproporphyrinogen III oxidase